MSFYADLHIHSKYSRATSRDCDLEHLAWWARRKGIAVVATGDFTHPAWWEELKAKLVPAEPGLFRLRPEIEAEIEARLPARLRAGAPVRFLLEVEISTIYKKAVPGKDERTRKVHHLLYAGCFETAGEIRRRLGAIGNIASDGRPILGLDSRDLLEITLESGPDAYLIPAHIWTPWFAAMGSKSGFDSIEECYGDLADRIFAVETGLSSDPPMNWRLSCLDRFTLVSSSDAHSPPMLGREASVFDCELDYFAMRRALETGIGFGGTVEFFPEEGKYHLDGHRACGVCLEPAETRQRGGLCPECGKPVTVGVMHRVEELADRPEVVEKRAPFRSLVPLPEIVAEIEGVGPKTKTVARAMAGLIDRLGPELPILESLPPDEAEAAGEPLLAEALRRLRAGTVTRQGGFDGEYGVIRLFEPQELARRTQVAALFPEMTAVRASGEAAASPAVPDLEPADLEPADLEPAAGTPPPPPLSPPPTPPPARPRPLALPCVSPLDALDPDQRAAAEVAEGALLIVAGPGTGKTRTLTHRLAHLVDDRGVAPERCLAVTFTRRAAGEMAERLADLLPGAGERITVATFHGLGLLLLRELAESPGGEEIVTLPDDWRIASAEEADELAGELLGCPAAAAGKRREEIGGWRRRRLLDRLAGRDSAEEGARSAGCDDRELAEQAGRYEEALAERGWLDYDDLLLEPVAAFDRRPELLDRARARFAYLAIDEYQDIDPLQYRLVRQLAPTGGNLCAIGDPDQSIYAFRGADVGFFLRFRRDYPDARVVELARNYRSSGVIVTAALQAIRPTSLAGALTAGADGGGGRRLEAVAGPGGPPVALRTAANPSAEGELIARTIEELLGGTSYYSLDSGQVSGTGEGESERPLAFSDFAVLARTAAQAAPIAEALGRAGIPYQLRSHRTLDRHRGVAALVAKMEESMEESAGAASENGERPASVEALLQRAHEELATGDREHRGVGRAELAAAVDMVRPLALVVGEDRERFRTEVALSTEVDTLDPRAERVSLLTLHAAKGLEWPVVFLAGCEEGLLPLVHPGAASGEEEDERALAEREAEERRLFFVGITRARRRLIVTRAESRRRYGQLVRPEPSPFLADLDEALIEHGPEPTRKAARRQLKLF